MWVKYQFMWGIIEFRASMLSNAALWGVSHTIRHVPTKLRDPYARHEVGACDQSDGKER